MNVRLELLLWPYLFSLYILLTQTPLAAGLYSQNYNNLGLLSCKTGVITVLLLYAVTVVLHIAAL